MRVFLRTFNNKINSKTGTTLPEGQYRGTPEWITFQNILIDCLRNLGHSINEQVENPVLPQWQLDDYLKVVEPERFVYVHQNKREYPNGNLFWMQMHMRELFTIDTNGWGADHSGNKEFNSDEIDQEEATAFNQQKSKQLVESKESKCEQPEETDKTPENFILVPLQIPRDYTIKHHSPITVRYFIDSVISWAEESKTHICIKMHPHNQMDQDLHETVNQGAAQSEFVHKVEGNIHELIKRSSGLFVINSGTGFESLIHGKPVCTFGDCDYSRATFGADIRRLDEARDFLYSYKDDERSIGYQLVYWYYMKHGYDVNATNTPSRLTEYLRRVL